MISQEELYRRTGIQKQSYNTIYQLQAIKEKYPEQLEEAETMLMLPDYFHFLLSGEKKMEYTIASTSQMVDAKTGDWDWELIEKLGFPKKIFRSVDMPGTLAVFLCFVFLVVFGVCTSCFARYWIGSACSSGGRR